MYLAVFSVIGGLYTVYNFSPELIVSDEIERAYLEPILLMFEATASIKKRGVDRFAKFSFFFQAGLALFIFSKEFRQALLHRPKARASTCF
jgi:hypothetical protein